MPPTDPDLRRDRWGTRIALITAGLTVLGVIAGGVMLAHNTNGFVTITDGETEAGHLGVPGDAVADGLAAPAFNYTFHGYAAGGLKVTEPVLATPGYQEAQVRRPYEVVEKTDDAGTVTDTLQSYGALLTVYRPGVYDPVRYTDQESITIGGRLGWYSENMPYRDGYASGELPAPGLAWEYADDAWAVISTVGYRASYPREDFIAIAEGFKTVDPYPATTPIDLVSVPDGFTLVSGGASADAPVGVSYLMGSVRLIGQRPEYRGITAPIDPVETGQPTVVVSVYDAAWAKDTEGLKPGEPATCPTEDVCRTLSADGRWVTEAHTRTGQLEKPQLKKIVNEAVIADVSDHATWFPLTDAAS
ncbi:hypothetical protein [Catenuloplanes japonicus]|uniref:hypothetical protein n=1 Tax=Catenuloplanes japonicus TaxID=33876 RepID=UPI0012F8325B|nr:hypothetical protein [Catenuloplanes japonicus]